MRDRIRQWEHMLKDYPPNEARRVVAAAEKSDPTRHRGCVTWILNQFRAGAVRLPEDAPAVRRLLEEWERVKGRLQIAETLDIGHFGYRQLTNLVNSALAQGSTRQRLAQVKREGSHEVYEVTPYRILKLTTPAAAAAYSRSTRWCTSDQECAAAYLSRGPLFLILKNNKTYALAHPANREFKDRANLPVALPDAELTAAILAAVGPGGFWFAAELEVQRCYRERDFESLRDLLRSFDGTNLLTCPLSYLSNQWVDALAEIFRPDKNCEPLRAAQPSNDWSRSACMAFLWELRFDRLRPERVFRPKS